MKACPFIMERKEVKSDRYIEETKRSLLRAQWIYNKHVFNKIHFNQHGHTVSYVRITILKKLRQLMKATKKKGKDTI